jgi:hypothetical protein
MEESERKQIERASKRSKGFKLKQLWVHETRLKEYEEAKERLKTPRIKK